MSAVLAVLEHGAADQPVADVATAIAAVMSASVRRIDLTGVAGPARKADRVLTELAEAASVLGVLSGAASLAATGLAGAAAGPQTCRPGAGGCPPGPADDQPRPYPARRHPGVSGCGRRDDPAARGRRSRPRRAARLRRHDGPQVLGPARARRAGLAGEFLARYCDHPGVRLQLRSGVPGEHVLDVATTEQVDLIALGWSQQPGQARAQTLRQTLRDAHVPVLVVPIVTPP